MPRVHRNIAEKERERVEKGQSLLSDQDRAKVDHIIAFVKDIQNEVSPLVKQKKSLQKASLRLEKDRVDTLGIQEFLEQTIDDIEYLSLDSMLNNLLDGIEQKFIDLGQNFADSEQLLAHFSAHTDGQEESIKHNIKNELNELLVSVKEKIDKIEQDAEALDEKKSQNLSQIEDFQERLNQYMQNQNIQFEVNDSFDLTKISRKGGGIEFSVIFAQKDGNVAPFILYRGKMHEGAERKLGEGGFGLVKLAQDYQTNELLAVKIQKSSMLPEEIYETEKNMLNTFSMLKGAVKSAQRDKDYLIQNLLYGVDLEKHLKESRDLEEILNIMTEVTREISKLHEGNLIHRDIKLENFMWDPEEGKINMIDFAFVVEVDGDEIKDFRDEAGSDQYKSPEVIEQGAYSKRSDIFALGVMLEEMIKDAHPDLYAILETTIQSLKKDDINQRAMNLKDTLRVMEQARKELDKSKKPRSKL